MLIINKFLLSLWTLLCTFCIFYRSILECNNQEKVKLVKMSVPFDLLILLLFLFKDKTH